MSVTSLPVKTSTPFFVNPVEGNASTQIWRGSKTHVSMKITLSLIHDILAHWYIKKNIFDYKKSTFAQEYIKNKDMPGLVKGFLAAVMMFTRIPLWRFIQVDKKYYAQVLLYWPLVGFLTGLTTWGTLYVASLLMPLFPACVLAVIARLWSTGALHEDGLADFLDGFGGGHDKVSILRIMKDSHIGSYGTIGLIVYFVLYVSLLSSFYSLSLAGVIIGADVLSKFSAAVMINSLPYVRPEEESKAKVLYRQIRFYEFAAIGAFCMLLLWWLSTPFLALIPTFLVVCCLRWYFKYKIGGYTGDCCGATVLLAEQFFYIGATIVYTYSL